MPHCDHAVFRVADLDRSVEFYMRVLPAQLVSRKQHEDCWRSEIATLRPEGQPGFSIVLIMPRRVRWILWLLHHFVPRQSRSHEHLGFVCGSREELEARARAAHEIGARVENALAQLEGREGWLFEVLDPDQNAIEWTFGVVHD
ncbi:MAG: VOC family protein [Planctomycetes bacterium]|nr:VOC family protein [Planctomycetota bacterium]